MRTLDLTPVLTAMRERPGDFEMDDAWLRHRPSRHSFLVARGKLERIEAACSCAELRVEPQQAEQFAAVHNAWIEAYWCPLQIQRAAQRRAAEINRQFAAHFLRPSRLHYFACVLWTPATPLGRCCRGPIPNRCLSTPRQPSRRWRHSQREHTRGSTLSVGGICPLR